MLAVNQSHSVTVSRTKPKTTAGPVTLLPRWGLSVESIRFFSHQTFTTSNSCGRKNQASSSYKGRAVSFQTWKSNQWSVIDSQSSVAALCHQWLTMVSTMQTPSITRHRKEEMIPKLRNTIAAVSWRKKKSINNNTWFCIWVIEVELNNNENCSWEKFIFTFQLKWFRWVSWFLFSTQHLSTFLQHCFGL